MSMVGNAKSLYQWVRDLGESSPSLRKRYGVAPGYFHRVRSRHYDDTHNTDGWQKEVYIAAADLMRKLNLRTVYDVGCGSGYKLITLLGEYETIGFDVEETVAFLKHKYPGRKWRSVSFDDMSIEPADLVICSDVLEHVSDPDALIKFLHHVVGQYLILSTPERNLLYRTLSPRRRGPPGNPTHFREWTFRELNEYISKTFDIVEHRITNREQGTQMVVCRPRRRLAPDSRPSGPLN